MKKAVPLFCAVLLAASVPLVAGCGQNATQVKTPTRVTRDFINALEQDDLDTAYDMLTAEDKKAITRTEWREEAVKELGTVPGNEPVSYRVMDEKIKGKEAVVGVRLSQGGESDDMYIALSKEGGTWKVSLGRSNTMNN